MSADMTSQTKNAASAPKSLTGRLRLIGPGIVLALASVGASDMITTMNSGAEYGLALIWVFTVGIILKFVLSEAVARLQMSGDRSLLSHLTGFGGRTFPALFLIAELLVGLFFGAGVVAVTTNILQAIFPVLPFWPTAVVVLLSASVLVGIGRYGLVEKAMMGFGIIMFFGIIALAISVFQSDGAHQVAAETVVPTFPNTSIITVMSLIGGVGGATGILAYSFWIREKAWRTPDWKPVVRLDLFISYGLVFVFAVAMSAVGAFILYGQGFTISDNDALFAIADTWWVGSVDWPDRSSSSASSPWCIRACSAGSRESPTSPPTASACCVATRIRTNRRTRCRRSRSSSAGCWSTSRSQRLVIMSLGKPVTLVLVYAAISAFILPVLALALLVILNRSSVPAELRNTQWSNVLLARVLGAVRVPRRSAGEGVGDGVGGVRTKLGARR